MALLNAFVELGCRGWVVAFEALMVSTSELIFYTVLLPFQEKSRKFAANFARYFCNILENNIKFKVLKDTAGR